ncbi:cathepsin L1-like [Hyposmocoma kahamanoa]|uniref:cathepsin L1-like n=1 Tax=Hyposmocoma kahamanoa TaxID=1477025 RepID=UPI000E6D7A6E|nr:cathepsin L1-like [Hyposmocoma kahamanoa]
MLIIVILLKISLINCNLNISDTANKIRYLLNSCKNSRFRRCSANAKLDNFVSKTLDVLERTEYIGDYLKNLNVSQCPNKSLQSDNYINEHIFNGMPLHKDVPDSHWQEYKKVYKKQYTSRCHEKSALSTWKENLRKVIEHNRLFLDGKLTFSLNLNHFGDLGEADYFKNILKLIDTVPLFDPAEDHHRSAFRRNAHVRVPRKVDWRARGFKPKLEEQWHCGACYAFAVTHALQAQLYRKHGDWRELSPQQIVDCSYTDGNMGCDGGSLRAALRYVTREGLTSELHYPYIGKKGFCHYNRLFKHVKPRRWAMLPFGDEAAMERALATIGPLAVAINAAPFTFQLYRSGIYDDPFCIPWELNHAMLLVGYTRQYWILLNWWGKNWGEDGYIRIRRGFNRCGVANMAAYVEL